MTGSNTGALEAAMWSLLGSTGVDVMAWENFGKDWVIDVLDQLKIKDVNSYVTDYGILPDLTKVNLDILPNYILQNLEKYKSNFEVNDIKSLGSAQNKEITFFDSIKYKDLASLTKASACITKYQ